MGRFVCQSVAVPAHNKRYPLEPAVALCGLVLRNAHVASQGSSKWIVANRKSHSTQQSACKVSHLRLNRSRTDLRAVVPATNQPGISTGHAKSLYPKRETIWKRFLSRRPALPLRTQSI